MSQQLEITPAPGGQEILPETTNLKISVNEAKRQSSRKGELLHQCLPISALNLFDGYLLTIGEGPCLLLRHSKIKSKHSHEKFKRYQLFPNQLTITGIHFVEDSCGYPSRKSLWDGPDEDHSVAFVWAGNHGIFITLNRHTLEIHERDTYPLNSKDSLSFNYIPIAARWFNDGKTLVILSVFNYIIVYERTNVKDGIKGLKEIAKYECEQENLYSGAMAGEELEDLIVFSGTTFQGILIWDIKDGKANVRHKLTGHKGIPFSLEFQSDWQMLLSASDDRDVLLWSFINEKDGIQFGPDVPIQIDDGYLEFRKSQVNTKLPECVKITHRITGHEARCWKAIWVKHAGFTFILSVGEDSYVRVQSFDRTFFKSWKAHDGASIYHCAFDEDDDILYTAAHDGSVFQWKRFYLKTQSIIVPFDVTPKDPRTEGMFKVNEYGRSILNKDFTRSISLWNTSYVVASMDSGRIIAFHLQSKNQFELYYNSNFKRYSVLSVSRQSAITAVGGLNGDFIVLRMSQEDTPGGSNVKSLFSNLSWSHKFESKVLNIIWLKDDKENHALIVCLEQVFLFRFFYVNKEKTEIHGELLKSFNLPLERPGVPTALLKDNFLIIGDEVGSFMILPVDSSESQNPIQILKDIHQEGVTSIVEYKGTIMTSGRYGGVKSFKLEGKGHEPRLVKIHEFAPTFEWIGKLLPIRNEEDLLVVGFQKGDLILYSWKDKRIISEVTDVGGGHRRWDLRFEDGDVTFSYIRDKEIYFSRISFDDCVDSILKPGLHCKTINCGIELLTKNNNLYTATGSEDGTIRVFRYDFLYRNYFPIHRINSHASSVRTLACLPIDPSRVLLFSAGGRSELIAFLVGLDVEELTQWGQIMLVKTKNRDTEIDLRVMDLKVIKLSNDSKPEDVFCFCACSDGIVRALRFSFQHKKFTIVSLLHGNEHGVMKIQIIQTLEQILIFGATSNGNLIVWNWKAPSNQTFEFIKNPEIINPSFSKRVRNASVMCFKIVPSSKPNNFIMVLGSDDCCISSWSLIISLDKVKLICIEIQELWSQDQTQRGPVVGVEILRASGTTTNQGETVDERSIYTCSNDQVISRCDMNGKLLGKAFAGVSDCQGFIVNLNQDCITCFGNGITWINSP